MKSVLFAMTAAIAMVLIVTNAGASEAAPVGGLRLIWPVIDVAAKNSELAKLSPDERRRFCHTNIQTAPLDRQLKMSGQIDRAEVNSQRFANALFAQVAAYFYSPGEHYAGLAKMVREAADLQAFTELTPYHRAEAPKYNLWNEPAYAQAILLVPVAIAYLVVKHEEPGNAESLASIKRWGDALLASASAAKDEFISIDRGVDRRSMKASGYAFWGNATNNNAALSMAFDDYKTILKTIDSSGADNAWKHKGPTQLYYANMTWAPMTLIAYALRRSGVSDAFEMTSGGGNIQQGADWLIAEMKVRSDPIVLAGRHAGSRSIAWLEQLVAENPSSSYLSSATKDTLEGLRRPLYVSLAGGPVTCLFRKVLLPGSRNEAGAEPQTETERIPAK